MMCLPSLNLVNYEALVSRVEYSVRVIEGLDRIDSL